jgi:hypothetical protein
VKTKNCEDSKLPQKQEASKYFELLYWYIQVNRIASALSPCEGTMRSITHRTDGLARASLIHVRELSKPAHSWITLAFGESGFFLVEEQRTSETIVNKRCRSFGFAKLPTMRAKPFARRDACLDTTLDFQAHKDSEASIDH